MSLAAFLFSEYRRRVLALLLLQPEKQFHQREIARLTDTISGTLSRELSKMTDAGILLKVPVGNQMHYKANPECPVFEELASILRKSDGWLNALADALRALGDQINVAFVFGSMASGRAGPDSDIDLMVIGNVTFSALIEALYPLQSTLGREINPKQYPIDEWLQLVKNQNGFVRDLLDKPKLFLIGTEKDLGALHKE